MAPAGFYGGVDIGREYCGYHAEVGGKVCNAQSAGNVDEHILLHKLEAYALFEYGKKHVEPALVEACGRTLRCAVWLKAKAEAKTEELKSSTLVACLSKNSATKTATAALTASILSLVAIR